MKQIMCFLVVAVTALWGSAAWAHQIVTFNSVLGTFQVEMFEDVAPKTVENFLNYVLDGDYTNTFIHRSVQSPTPFVIQGGGFRVTVEDPKIELVPTDPPVVNEFHLSNLRGTISMAKTADPNSATSQWFINLSNNSQSLDSPTNSGGFTVFGQVIGTGMTVVDAIAALPVLNAGGNFKELPVWNYTSGDIQLDNLVKFSSITTPLPWQNPDPTKTLDVSGNGVITPQDVGLIVNELNAHGARKLSSVFSLTDGEAWYFDTTGDRKITPQDVIYVVNALNAMAQGGVGASAATTGSTPGGATPVPEPSTIVLITAAAGFIAVKVLLRHVRVS